MGAVAVALILQIAEHLEHDLRKLRAGDVVRGTQGAVLIALDDAGLHNTGHFRHRPGADCIRVLEVLQIRSFAFHIQQAGDDNHGLLTGDGVLRAECTFRIAYKEALARGGKDFLHVPALGHILEGNLLDFRSVKRTIQHRRHFVALDAGIGTKGAVGTTLYNPIFGAIHNCIMRPVVCRQIGKAGIRGVRGNGQPGKQADDQRQNQCEG